VNLPRNAFGLQLYFLDTSLFLDGLCNSFVIICNDINCDELVVLSVKSEYPESDHICYCSLYDCRRLVSDLYSYSIGRHINCQHCFIIIIIIIILRGLSLLADFILRCQAFPFIMFVNLSKVAKLSRNV
jgi:hypothetical protein